LSFKSTIEMPVYYLYGYQLIGTISGSWSARFWYSSVRFCYRGY